MKTYSELIRIPDFDERLKYLYIGGGVGEETFGFDRWLNQVLYRSGEWRLKRNEIILRDCGCDLACKGYDIYDKIYIHHIEPITKKDIVDREAKIFDNDNLVCVSFDTHQMIHFGVRDENLLALNGERHAGDTKLW